jgi:micrococcal nuclease
VLGTVKTPDQIKQEVHTQYVNYKNCTEARTAGVEPIYKGQPGYTEKFDRDSDGIACE